MTLGSTASETCGTCISSTSRAASSASRLAASAATRPASMLAPSALVATGSQRAQRGRGHPGGGGLAVGAGDDDGAPARPELAQNRAVQRHRDQAADHRAGPAPGDPRRPARARPRGEGQTCAGGNHPRSLRAIASAALWRRAQRVARGTSPVELSRDTIAERPGDVGPTCHSQAMKPDPPGVGRPASRTGDGPSSMSRPRAFGQVRPGSSALPHSASTPTAGWSNPWSACSIPGWTRVPPTCTA